MPLTETTPNLEFLQSALSPVAIQAESLGLAQDPQFTALMEKSIQAGGTGESIQRIKDFLELEQQRRTFATEIFGSPTATLEQALESTAQGELGQLSRALLQQQQTAFQAQLPFLQQRLQQQGIFDSGSAFALPAAQLGALEQQRQGTLLAAGLGAKESLRNLRLGESLSGIAFERQAAQQRYQNYLIEERNNLMRQLSQYNAPSFLQKFGGILGAGLGAALAIPTGGVSIAGGAALGGLLGGAGGSFFGSGGSDPNQYLSLIAALQGQTGGR